MGTRQMNRIPRGGATVLVLDHSVSIRILLVDCNNNRHYYTIRYIHDVCISF